MFPLLETERLSLRKIEKEDAEDIFRCFSDPDVTRYYGQESFTSFEQAEQIIEMFNHNYKERRGIRWGMELKDRKGIIGSIGFNAWVPKYKRAEIGYELHPGFWRKGYASEAVKAVVDYGFNHLDLNRIGAVVFLENTASNDLLIKLGFEKEGVLRNYIYQNGISYDTNVYSLVKNH
ncbi:GNAT family N-acetyltransferase [Heyndrickxia oleronia]|uniref:GNAT family N-acetyltransferase n=1 Tax=Heyndrickxia oleronia TaxID=38875 RepID=UPI00203DC7B7|nr:GNAT family N-acetyltransferase [Heyndrickxia oleronia]